MKMKQVLFSHFGQPSMVAKCVDVDRPAPPSAWEVMVDIEAFPINPADLAQISGRYGSLPKLPSTIGMEAIGTITSVGSSVREFESGDRVVILANNNWAEQRRVPAAAVYRVPRELDVQQLSMLKVNPATAWLMINSVAKLQPGDWVLQNAPLSGVGRCVIQIAKSMGVKTLNIIRRPEAQVDIAELGGDAVVLNDENMPQRVRQIVGHSPLRWAFDAVAGEGVQLLADCLSESGTIINYGMLSNEPIHISPDHTIFRGISIKGFWVSKVLNRLSQQERTQLFGSLVELFAKGTLHCSIDSTFPLARFQEAIAKAERSDRSGKVIVLVKDHHA